jgi:hypothetical protein
VSASARRGLRGREGTHSRARENRNTNVSSIVSDEIYKLVTPAKTVKAFSSFSSPRAFRTSIKEY